MTLWQWVMTHGDRLPGKIRFFEGFNAYVSLDTKQAYDPVDFKVKFDLSVPIFPHGSILQWQVELRGLPDLFSSWNENQWSKDLLHCPSYVLSSAWLLPWKAPGQRFLEPSQWLHPPIEATWRLSVNMKALSRQAFVCLHKGKFNPKRFDYNNPRRNEIQSCIFPF